METTKDFILALKAVRNEKNLSFDQILDLMAENNQFLSKSTLSRVFADGSEENGNFRYETLRPIADVLLDIEHIESDDTTDTKAYKTILKLKKDIIDELKEELVSKNEQMEHRINKEKIKYHEKLEKETKHFNDSLAFMTHQIELKDQRIDALLTTTTELMATNNKLLKQLMDCPLRNDGCNED